ncbi:MAG: hypothetical protein P8H39_12445 [Thalassotalea sp.]|nr:hypothetical protein [Thalassotalea sp.]
MTTIYLHIGQEKTGTTSIQQFLVSNRKFLFDTYGILYPYNKKISTDNKSFFNHAKFTGSFLDYKERSFVKMERLLTVKDSIEELKLVIKKKKPKAIIISSEHLSSRLNGEHIKELAKQLDSYDVKIICYVRRQDDYQISRFSESLKSGAKKWLKLKANFSKNKRLNYLDNLSPWLDWFGRESIILCPFDKKRFVNESLYDDFLSKLGVSEFSKFIVPDSSNISVSKEEADVLLALNKVLLTWADVNNDVTLAKFRRSQEIRKEVLTIMQTNRDIKVHTALKDSFSKKDKEHFMSHFIDSNRKLSELYYNRKELFPLQKKES